MNGDVKKPKKGTELHTTWYYNAAMTCATENQQRQKTRKSLAAKPCKTRCCFACDIFMSVNSPDASSLQRHMNPSVIHLTRQTGGITFYLHTSICYTDMANTNKNLMMSISR